MFAYLKAKLFGINVFESMVPGRRGKCYPVWTNENQVVRRLGGPGVSGFFKPLDGRGREFHGIIWTDGLVWPTDGVVGEFRGPDATMTRVWCECITGCGKCGGMGDIRMSVRKRAELG